MDDEVVIIGDDGTEHVFPAGFDPKRAAAIVRGDGASVQTSTPVTPGVLAGLGGMAAAPGVLAGVNTVANAARQLPTRVTHSAPLVGAIIAAGDVAEGRYKKAAFEAGASVAPAALRAVAMKTGPASTVGMSARALSRFSGLASLPAIIASSLYDSNQYGQSQAKKLDDPNITAREKDQILQQLHSAGGF